MMLVSDYGVGLVSLSAFIFGIKLTKKYCIAARLSFTSHPSKSNAAGAWICAL